MPKETTFKDKSRKVSNREAYHLARLVSREETLNKIVAGIQREMQIFAVEKNAVLTAYGLPENCEFEFNEETNEVIIHGDKNQANSK